MNYNTNILGIVKEKWEVTLNEDILYETDEKSFKKIPRREEGAYVKYFQFRLLHNRIMTKERLYKMKISKTDICQFCMLEKETIRHAFLKCPKVVTLWKQVEKLCREKISTDTKFQA